MANASRSDPYEFILGSQTLNDYGGIVDYRHLKLRLKIGGVEQKSFFTIAPNPGFEAASPLFASETVSIPARSTISVPINTSSRTNLIDGQWGTTSNITSAEIIVAKHAFPIHRHQNWLQLSNLSDFPVVVRRGKAVAAFHRKTKINITSRTATLM